MSGEKVTTKRQKKEVLGGGDGTVLCPDYVDN